MAYFRFAPKRVLFQKNFGDNCGSPKADASKAWVSGFTEIKELLNDIANDVNNRGVCNTATSFYNTMFA